MRLGLFFVWLLQLVMLFGSRAEASTLSYGFSGTVTFVGGAPYGATIANFSALTGQFTYDTASAQTHVLTNGVGYEQHFTNGFQAVIGGVSVSANDYLVEVSDNVTQPNSTVTDIFAVVFSSALNPALTDSLVVNGTGHSVGLFSLQLVGGSSLWSGTALPTSLSTSQFTTSKIGMLSHAATGIVDVIFNVTEIHLVPEPSTTVLTMTALCSLLIASRRFVNCGCRRNDRYRAMP